MTYDKKALQELKEKLEKNVGKAHFPSSEYDLEATVRDSYDAILEILSALIEGEKE